jgi:formylglycine-generating enzyme required for sulfatase activity
MPCPDRTRLRRALVLLVLAVLFVLAPSLPRPAAVLADAVALPPEPDAPDQDALLHARLGDGGAFALVLGLGSFEARSWPDLPGIADEVEAVSRALHEQGFQVVRPTPPDGRMTKAQLREEVARFVAAYGARPENRLVLYFATHGYREEDGYGLLIASDSLTPNAAGFAGSAYSVGELSADLSPVAARHVYIFVNACFSGAMLPFGAPADSDARALAEDSAAMALRLLDGEARMILTAGSDDQEVPDRDNPFARAVTGGLGGAADLDGDGLILGTELAQHVRASVARETLAKGRPNDPVLAVLPGPEGAASPALRGDFVFMAPGGPRAMPTGTSDAVLAARSARLPGGQFTECADCPVMVELPVAEGPPRLAMARTETSFAEWDACYREFGCRRYLPDDGLGRGDRPAGGVTWADALEFTAWMNGKRRSQCTAYRLPEAAEWLAAAGVTEAGASGQARPDHAVCRDCGTAGGISAPQAGPPRGGSLPANPLGLHDMGGSLWEWLATPTAPCDLAQLMTTDACPDSGIVIGGAFSTKAAALDNALLGAAMPRSGNRKPFSLPTVGLRLICDLDPAVAAP